MPIIIRIYERSNQLGYRQSAVQRAWKCPLDSSFIRPGFTIRFLPSLSRNVRWIYEDNYTLLSLTIRPSLQTEWQTTLLRTVLSLFSLFLFRFHSLLLESSRRVRPSFSFDEHSVDFVRSRIEFRPCNPGIRITPSSLDRCKFVGIAENGRELRVPAASVSREWSCSSSTMVDGALDAPNDLFFAQNEMESGYTPVKWTEHIFVLSS